MIWSILFVGLQVLGTISYSPAKKFHLYYQWGQHYCYFALTPVFLVLAVLDGAGVI